MTKSIPSDQDRIEILKARLGLRPLKGEGGWFNEAHISELMVESADEASPASNCIYYLLTQEQPQNHLHHLTTDDYHILIEGGPADYYIFHPDGSAEMQTLGRDIANGERPMVVSPGRSRKAIKLKTDSPYVLIGSVVTPAWNPKRVTIGAGPAFMDEFTGKAPWATSGFLKSLIGPNWKPNS